MSHSDYDKDVFENRYLIERNNETISVSPTKFCFDALDNMAIELSERILNFEDDYILSQMNKRSLLILRDQIDNELKKRCLK